MAARIASIQPENGLWCTSLLNPDAYPGGETSGTGFYCYALAYGINSGLLSKHEYLPVVKKAWEGLNAAVNDEGMLGYVQQIAGSPDIIRGEGWEVYGSGAFLLAGSEVIKLDL